MKARKVFLSRLPLAALLASAGFIASPLNAFALQRTEVRHQNNVEFVTGGIGEKDQERTRQLGRDMNLQLVFARNDGAYLADVHVTIQGKGGEKMLEVNSADPMLFAELAPGRYEVTAAVDGRSIERDVTVPGRGQRVEYFRWQAR